MARTPSLCQILIAVTSSLFFGRLLFEFYFSDSFTDWIEAEQDELDIQSIHARANKTEVFERWHSCISEKILGIDDSDEFWSRFSEDSAKCDSEAGVQKLGIVTLRNSDEKKHVVLPKSIENGAENNLFTIGVGRDIRAEKQFRRKMSKLGNSVKFYGADPISYINSDLYSQIGTFFPFAVGANSGISWARVMEKNGYTEKNVIHIDISYFFRDILRITKIDNLWFDAEGAEFGGIFDIFRENGRFQRDGIDICQVNIEIHISSNVVERKAIFMEFVKKIVEERIYGFFFADEFIHMRMFMLNFKNQYCLNKF